MPDPQRKENNSAPQSESDVFIFSGAEDLVPVPEENAGSFTRITFDRSRNNNYTVQPYRPRIEGRRVRGNQIENLLPNLATVLGGNGSHGGGYIDLDTGGNWWVPSGRTFYRAGGNPPVPPPRPRRNPPKRSSISLSTNPLRRSHDSRIILRPI